MREHISTTGKIFPGAGNFCSADDATRWCKENEITAERLLRSAESGVSVGNKGLLVSEGKIRIYGVTSRSSSTGVKNIIWDPKGPLVRGGRVAVRAALWDPRSLAAVRVRRAGWEFWCTLACRECSRNLLPVTTPNSSWGGKAALRSCRLFMVGGVNC